MYVSCVEHVRAWKPAVPGVSEVFHADFAHAYPPHTHDTWTVCIVDAGAIRYDLDRHHLGAVGSTVILLPPHVVHDGRPATGHAYRKRVLYLETGLLDESLIGRAVDAPSVEDVALRARLDRLHGLLRDPDDALAAESLLAFVAERLTRHLRAHVEPAPHAPHDLARRLRAVIDARPFEQFTLAAAAARLGTTPAHLVRSFSRTFGIAPHAYVLARRIEAARLRLLDGEPIARVAVGVGFYDQAHFTRHFKRHVGTTPGRYATGGASKDEGPRSRSLRSTG